MNEIAFGNNGGCKLTFLYTSCREIKALRAFRNRLELVNSFWFKATVSGVMENQEQDLDR